MFAKDRTLATARNRGNRTRARSSPKSAPPGSFGYDYKVGPSVSPASLVRLITLPGGNSITNELDSVGRLTSTRLLNPAANQLNVHSYTYDLAGERTKQTRTDGSYVDYGVRR
jgi:YD repeat-containing protein